MTLVSGSHVLIGIVPQGGALFLQAKLSASPPAANPARVDSVAIALAAQLAEIRRSDDRLFTLVLWTLGITATIALGLAVFSWWTSHKVYERDIDAIKKENRAIAEQAARELTASLQSATRSVQDSMKRELGEQFSSQLLRFNSEFVSLASVKVGRLRLQIGDYSGAIREAEECYNAASTGNTNYIAHALDLMSETLDTATQAAAAIGTEDLTTVQRVLHGYANPSDPRAARLQQLLESARARS